MSVVVLSLVSVERAEFWLSGGFKAFWRDKSRRALISKVAFLGAICALLATLMPFLWTAGLIVALVLFVIHLGTMLAIR